jgi:ATP-dependent DNA helicase RecG
MNDTHDIIIPFWKQPESRRLELKEVFPKGDQLVRTVVAFANGAGGKIVFGVRNEPREILGIPDNELFPLEEKVSNHIFDRCTPVIIPEIYIQAVEGKNLLVMEIFPGPQKPYYLKSKGKHKGTYVRIGSSNRPASQEMLESLERDKRKISFDAIPVYDLSPEDLDLKRFKEDYKNASGHALNKENLKNIGLLVFERDTSHPTHAAVLISESPARKHLFPYAKVECARFKGTDTKVFLDQATIEGPVYAAVKPCLAFIKKNIALSSKIGEVYREDRWEYPLEAIREAITNAIIHRDYAILGSDIKVAIFDDMLEITSPGPLPDTLPLEELGTGRSEIRNRVLAPIFKDLKLIEAWGTGIQKMRNEVSKYPEIELVLHEVGHAFQVQFRKKEVGTKQGLRSDQVGTKQGLSSDQLLVLGSCTEAHPIVDLMRITKRSNRTKFRKKVLNPLIEEGLIAMTDPDSPNSPKQRYRTTAKGQALLEQREK